jgi:DNA-binding NtrC family response regulator
MKLLVVDDEAVVLESCRRILEAEGFEVLMVPNANEALITLKDTEVSMLLIDVKMPERDGMYLMERVREHWPQLPMLIMSGYHTDETIEEALQRGAAFFVAKPFTPDELLHAVRQVIEKETAHGDQQSPGD